MCALGADGRGAGRVAIGVCCLRSNRAAGDAPDAAWTLTVGRRGAAVFQELIRLTSGPAGSGLLGFPLQLRIVGGASEGCASPQSRGKQGADTRHVCPRQAPISAPVSCRSRSRKGYFFNGVDRKRGSVHSLCLVACSIEHLSIAQRAFSEDAL